MTPEEIPHAALAEFLHREGYKLIIKPPDNVIGEEYTYGIEDKTGWGDAQFGRRVREILEELEINRQSCNANQKVILAPYISKIIEASRE